MSCSPLKCCAFRRRFSLEPIDCEAVDLSLSDVLLQMTDFVLDENRK